VIILIAHQKGGVGKSMLAVNLAAEAQRRGGDVLIVEADPTIHTARLWTQAREENGHKPIVCSELKGNVHDPLKELGRQYAHVFVDVAGKDSKELRTAMAAADILVAPMQPFQPDMDAALDLVETMREGLDLNPDLRVLSVLTRVPTNAFNSEARQATEYMEDYPELPLANVRIHERKTYRTALEQGLGVVETRDGKAKGEIQNLMNEILGER
jgi:chromosome partitioning protein